MQQRVQELAMTRPETSARALILLGVDGREKARRKSEEAERARVGRRPYSDPHDTSTEASDAPAAA